MNLAKRLRRPPARPPWLRSLPAITVAAVLGAALSNAQAAPQHAFHDDLERANPLRWERSDGWSNGSGYGCSWRADSVLFDAGEMSLILRDGRGRDRDLVCGEYRTREHFGFGQYTVSMKAARGAGVVNAFFIYTGPFFGDPWHETTIEILGKNTRKIQFTFFVDGKQTSKTIDLGFDAAEDFHVYAIDWAPDAIRWYVDDRLVHVAAGTEHRLPTQPGRIFTHIWNGDGLEEWTGTFRYQGEPLVAQVDWIRFVPHPSEQ
jgi:endo-1,3-1,4-beta-glycanase ExoK